MTSNEGVELAGVSREIKEVENEIKKVEANIKTVEEKLERNDLSERDVDYWRDEKNKLRDKEKQLREEKNKLRDEKNKLRDKEMLLITMTGASNPSIPAGQQRQDLTQLLSQEAIAGITAMALDFLAKKNTVVLSNATASAKNEILGMLKLPTTGAVWPNIPAILRDFPGFAWLQSDEDSEENRTAYMNHLSSHLQLPATYAIADVQPKRDLLNTEIKGIEESRRIRGTTDVVIAESRNIDNDAIRDNVEALLELKKPLDMRKKDHSPRAICEHVAASYLSQTRAIVSILTDLNRSWTFYWYAENMDGSGVALHTLKLKDDERAGGLARFIVERLKDGSRRENLPNTFVDRLTFRDVVERLVDDCSRKRHRGDSGGDDGGSSEARSENASRSMSLAPPSGLAGNSLSDIKPQKQEDAGDGGNQANSARMLLRLGNQSDNDIANELDLLDMVDEADQYEIVRNFVARHIIPHMTGKTL